MGLELWLRELVVLPSALKELKIKLNDSANIFTYAELLMFKDMSEHHKHAHFLVSLRLFFLVKIGRTKMELLMFNLSTKPNHGRML